MAKAKAKVEAEAGVQRSHDRARICPWVLTALTPMRTSVPAGFSAALLFSHPSRRTESRTTSIFPPSVGRHLTARPRTRGRPWAPSLLSPTLLLLTLLSPTPTRPQTAIDSARGPCGRVIRGVLSAAASPPSGDGSGAPVRAGEGQREGGGEGGSHGRLAATGAASRAVGHAVRFRRRRGRGVTPF